MMLVSAGLTSALLVVLVCPTLVGRGVVLPWVAVAVRDCESRPATVVVHVVSVLLVPKAGIVNR